VNAIRNAPLAPCPSVPGLLIGALLLAVILGLVVTLLPRRRELSKLWSMRRSTDAPTPERLLRAGRLPRPRLRIAFERTNSFQESSTLFFMSSADCPRAWERCDTNAADQNSWVHLLRKSSAAGSRGAGGTVTCRGGDSECCGPRGSRSASSGFRT